MTDGILSVVPSFRLSVPEGVSIWWHGRRRQRVSGAKNLIETFEDLREFLR